MTAPSPTSPGTSPWRRHLRPSLAELEAYDVAPTGSFARLHANECPEPWPRDVMDALAQVLAGLELQRYPDTSGRSLRQVLAQRHDCDPDRIVLGNGSDEIISILLTTLSGSEAPIVFPGPTFVMYRHFARVLGLPVREVEVDANFALQPDAMREALQGAALCFLARPNNPTGALWDRELIASLMHEFPQTVFVIDEAYIDFAPGGSLWRPDGPANYVHMATLSKSGLAGLRVGYCIAAPELAAELNKVRHPYNLSQTSLALAETMLTRFDGVRAELVAKTIANRERLSEILRKLPGATVYPSAANFVLARLATDEHVARLCAGARERSVLIKDISGVPHLERCVRVSVGTSDELDRLEQAVAALLGRR